MPQASVVLARAVVVPSTSEQRSGCTDGMAKLSHIFATATLDCELDLTATKRLGPLLDPSGACRCPKR